MGVAIKEAATMVGGGLSEMSYRRRMAVEAKLESLTTFQNLTLMTVADKH